MLIIIILINVLIWISFKNIFLLQLINLIYEINGILTKIIKIIDDISIRTLSNYPIDWLEVEYPPVAIVVIEWVKLSNFPIPNTQYDNAQRAVRPE